MPATARNIIWHKPARLYLEKAINYIRQDSDQNADTVAKAILAAVEKAARYPEHFPPDKYKINNSGAFRAFEIYHFRISFHADQDTVRIVRIRHTKQKPLNH